MVAPAYRHPKVVVGVPAFNEERFIADTLRSLQNQSHEDFLAVISDNASTDDTPSICHEFVARDPRFVYVRHDTNMGSAGNCNFLLDTSHSEYFMWLGAHDLLHPRFLAHHIAALDASPASPLSYSHTQWIDESGAITRVTPASKLVENRGWRWGRYLRSCRTVGECTAVNQLMRRSALQGFAFEKVAGADQVLLSRLLFFGEVCHTPEPLYFRRDYSSGSADYMERITGEKRLPRDILPRIEAYMRDIDRLPVSRPEKVLAKQMAKAALNERHLLGPSWFVTAVRAKRRVRSLVGKPRSRMTQST